MTSVEEVADCAICREFADSWWQCMKDPAQGAVDEERIALAAGAHLQDDHRADVLRPREGCDDCRTVQAILSAPFSAPSEVIIRTDGLQLHPSQLHFARHVLWNAFELP
ncbi:hypothetical protein [Streptomyces alanosinicus]|uniref:Uncharacterized protein n=1 Tax=Streptomyces alanosinicus TaxID=68171 RepID=A0A918YTJ1_9ACTN|nr:hypothetical protein [Streptomyces alanosinicus]GHE14688.1 hypothetical protein GCM10010339_86340 [Streptomyces alanosinicus]